MVICGEYEYGELQLRGEMKQFYIIKSTIGAFRAMDFIYSGYFSHRLLRCLRSHGRNRNIYPDNFRRSALRAGFFVPLIDGPSGRASVIHGQEISTASPCTPHAPSGTGVLSGTILTFRVMIAAATADLKQV